MPDEIRYSLAVQDEHDAYRAGALSPILAEDALRIPSSELDLLLGVNRSFSEKLRSLITASGRKDAEIYKAARIDRRHFSKILSNPSYQPTKDTVFAFALALRLNVVQTNDLLSRAGFLISHSSRRDIVLEHCLSREIYDLDRVNSLLADVGARPLGE